MIEFVTRMIENYEFVVTIILGILISSLLLWYVISGIGENK